eukprot:TRINITY_DN28768_c0_g1_i1.p1 TRINITY_DN28768_c0_g1~~TRINITY_DN28768_c0_g1_i1.p1  ORF type:complete len:1439 (-),score=289.64 TRINITY_DN28768_c0_g1_i1:31-4347(-)
MALLENDRTLWAEKSIEEVVGQAPAAFAIARLTEKESHVNWRDPRGWSLLFFAAWRKLGVGEVIRHLVDSGYDTNLQADKKFLRQTPLFLAARNHVKDAAEILIECRAEVDFQDSNKQTPLFWAAVNANIAVVEALLAHQADPCMKDINGQTALFYAVKPQEVKYPERTTSCVRALLKCERAGNDLASVKGSRGDTALFWAGERAPRESISLLIEHRCNVNDVDENGQSALFYAAKFRSDAVEEMLKSGADANLEDSTGQTAMFFAVIENKVEVCRLLLQAGADPHKTSNARFSPYRFVMEQKKSQELVDLFQTLQQPKVSGPERQPAVGIASNSGYSTQVFNPLKSRLRKAVSAPKTPPVKRRNLGRARAAPNEDVVKKLSQHGGGASSSTSATLQPKISELSELAQAVFQGSVNEARRLISNGANLKWSDIKTGLSLVSLAAKRHEHDDRVATDMCRMLVMEYKLAPVYVDLQGRTALFHAITRGHSECAAFLIQAGCNPTKDDCNKRTPLHLAAHLMTPECAVTLLKNLADPLYEDKDSSTPLLEAAVEGHQKTLQSLLNHPAVPLQLAGDLGDALLRNADLGCIELLASAGCIVDRASSPDGQLPPLHAAAHNGDLRRLEALIEARANVERCAACDGRTPLHWAVRNKQLDLCEILLTKYHADPEAQDASGQTPVMIARRIARSTQWKLGLQKLEEISKQRLERAAAEEKVRFEKQQRQWEELAAKAATESLAELRQSAEAAAREHLHTAKRNSEVGPGAARLLHAAASRTEQAMEACELLIETLKVEADCRDSKRRSALFDAAEVGNASVCSFLLSRGCRVNAVDGKGRNALFAAAQRGHTQVLEVLLAAHADAAKADQSRQTALLLACEHSQEKCIPLLLEAKAAPNFADAEGLAPLSHAAQTGSLGAAHALMAAGAAVQRPDKGGRTAVFIAVKESRSAFAAMLLDECAARPPGPNDMSVADDGRGNRELIDMARDRGFPEIVEKLKAAQQQEERVSAFTEGLLKAVSEGTPTEVSLLLQRKASPRSCKQDGRTALHYAARRQDEKALSCLERLLAAESKCDIADHRGQTPLFLAASSGLDSCLVLLLSVRCNPEASDDHGETPLFGAVREKRPNTVALLLKAGARPWQRDVNGRSAAFAALEAGSAALLKQLLDAPEGDQCLRPDGNGGSLLFRIKDAACGQLLCDRNCDVMSTDFFGRSPLHVAAKSGCRAAVQFLLERRASVNSADDAGRVALHYASDRCAASLLLAASAMVDARDVKKRTPLFNAVERNDAGTVRVLAAAGADGCALDENRRSALSIAAEKGASAEIICMLVREAGADPSAVDEHQRTPRDLAEASKQTEIANYLAAATSAQVRASGKEVRRRYALAFEESDDSSPVSQLIEFGSEGYEQKLRMLLAKVCTPGLLDDRWPKATVTEGPPKLALLAQP